MAKKGAGTVGPKGDDVVSDLGLSIADAPVFWKSLAELAWSAASPAVRQSVANRLVLHLTLTPEIAEVICGQACRDASRDISKEFNAKVAELFAEKQQPLAASVLKNLERKFADRLNGEDYFSDGEVAHHVREIRRGLLEPGGELHGVARALVKTALEKIIRNVVAEDGDKIVRFLIDREVAENRADYVHVMEGGNGKRAT